jgi:hypothetical protein
MHRDGSLVCVPVGDPRCELVEIKVRVMQDPFPRGQAVDVLN